MCSIFIEFRTWFLRSEERLNEVLVIDVEAEAAGDL